MPLRVRHGSWAECVVVGEAALVHKPDTYSWAEAAALPMQSCVAHAAVKAAGLLAAPVLDTVPHKEAAAGDVEVTAAGALVTKEGTDPAAVCRARVAVVGASSTTGLMVTDMLVSRGVAVLGVCSAPSAPAVIANGAVAVLDRKAGGLASRPADLKLEVVIDCVGGQEVEDAAREALGNRGHFVTIMGPGAGSFGDGDDGARGQMVQGAKIASRSLKGLFSSMKYTQAAMPVSDSPRVKILEQLMNENIKSVVDSEVDMFDEEAMLAAVEKVNSHKTRGRLIFTNYENC